jgi:hypothetical protein
MTLLPDSYTTKRMISHSRKRIVSDKCSVFGETVLREIRDYFDDLYPSIAHHSRNDHNKQGSSLARNKCCF